MKQDNLAAVPLVREMKSTTAEYETACTFSKYALKRRPCVLCAQKYKRETTKLGSKEASSIVTQGGTKNADLDTLLNFFLSPIVPSPLRRVLREESGEGALSTAQITHFIISGLQISIRTFSGFYLSGHYNLCAAIYYSCLQLATL